MRIQKASVVPKTLVRTICEELMVDISMENNDLESSILTCSPKKLDEKYLYFWVNAYIDMLKDYEINVAPRFHKLKLKFINADYWVYEILSLKKNKRGRPFNNDIDFREKYTAQKLHISERLPVTSLEDFFPICNSIRNIVHFKHWQKAHSFTLGFTMLLELAFEHRIDLGYQVLNHYLKQDNELNLVPGRLFNVIFQLPEIDPNKIYNILKTVSFRHQQEWLQTFYHILPERFIDKKWVMTMLSDHAESADRFQLHLQWYQYYENFKKGTIRDLIYILLKKHEREPDYTFKFEYNFFQLYPYLRDEDLAFAKKLYLLQDEMHHDFDAQAKDLFFLMEKDEDFFLEYVDHRIKIFSKEFSSPRSILSNIWSIENGATLVYKTLVKLANLDLFSSFRVDDFASNLLIGLSPENRHTVSECFEKLIQDDPFNQKQINIIWYLARNYLKEHYEELIQVWIRKLPPLGFLRYSSWSNNSFSYNNGRQIWADFRVTEYQQVHHAISSLPDQYLYIEYTSWLEERIVKEKNNGTWERKRLYRGFN